MAFWCKTLAIVRQPLQACVETAFNLLGRFVYDVRGWSLCEIMDQAGAGLYKAGQQQRLLFPEWKQDKMTISKKYAPLRA